MIYTEKNDDWNFRYTNIKKKVETWTIFGAAISAEIKQELKNTIFTHYLLITQSLLLSFYLLSNIQSVILLLVTYSYLNWTHKRLLITIRWAGMYISQHFGSWTHEHVHQNITENLWTMNKNNKIHKFEVMNTHFRRFSGHVHDQKTIFQAIFSDPGNFYRR